jgi:hypothetical protein
MVKVHVSFGRLVIETAEPERVPKAEVLERIARVSSGIKSGNRPDDAQATCTNHEWMPLHIRASGDTCSHAIIYTDPAQVVFVVFYI